MAKFTLEETGSGDFLTLPEDEIIQVVVDSTEVRHVDGKDGKDGWDKLNFRFKILELPTALEEEYASLIGSTIFGSVSAKLTTHPDNKLRKWAEALLDMDLDDPGFELDTEMLDGRKARGVVGQWVRKSDQQVNHQIKGLLPLVPAAVGSSGSQAQSFFDDEPPF